VSAQTRSERTAALKAEYARKAAELQRKDDEQRGVTAEQRQRMTRPEPKGGKS
jgi:uncharacterized small protein (DUF1192 family)